MPALLFLATCASTFWAGCTLWLPAADSLVHARQLVLRNWDTGLTFMVCVLGILLAHEMGHFVMTLLYRVPASLPFFVPFPFMPFGTMGAVIAMDGRKANRREIFDIGIAGPIAGLVIAVPVLWIGVQQLDLSLPTRGGYAVDLPLAVRHWIAAVQPAGQTVPDVVWRSQMNPYFMAGWFGLLITGLNMMPVSQLDGGHVIHALFGRAGRWIARGFLVLAIAFVVAYSEQASIWAPMILIVLLIGPDHPPTADDHVPLGWFRRALGLASLSIPFLCFPIYGIWVT